MRVALVLDDTLDRPDGVQQYVLTLGRWLAGRGHEVSYLVANTQRTDLPGVHSLGGFISTNFNGNAVRTPLPASGKRIRQVLKEVKPDVLHVQMPYSPLLAGRLIAAAPKTAVVGTFHVLPLGSWHMAANRALAGALRGTIRRFGAVMAVSQPAAAFARRAYGLQAEVVPNVVEVARFARAQHRQSAGNSVTVAFLGRLVERKGVLQLIRAWQAMRPEAKEQARLIIGGRGPLLNRAKALAGTDTGIEFIGFVPEAVKPDFFARADIACFPSTGGESFGIILVEAMAAGAGVVLGGNNPGYASVLGGVPDSLVTPGDVADFAEQLTKMILDPAARQRLHERQQKIPQRYDVESVGPEIERIYKQTEARLFS